MDDSNGKTISVLTEHHQQQQPPDPLSVPEECWTVAEETAGQVVNCVHPTLDTDEKRRDVIEHVQQLIRRRLGVEVFPYGSVPLKTYLPDGDIDLTAISCPEMDESLATDVLAVLREEEKKVDAVFELKDTQFIDAEVKLVKCIVQNIVMDISFNQLGGLCTLCFLEQVDRVVGKNHLFKRSILLIKAWCYYESRILGAHHGLLSTYALETLVLYIFQLFHPSLNGPLEVLYRFLDYYSKFDWDKYCVSFTGPACKSSLDDISAELAENGGNDLLLGDQNLHNCMMMFRVPPRVLETNPRAFPVKHMNIVDPLKENNNLGRSVHRGNFYRIRSAFKYGARKLGRILLLPEERISDEIRKFFANTLERHEKCQRTNMLDSAILFGDEGSDLWSLSSPSEEFSEDDSLLNFSIGEFENDSLQRDDECTFLFRNEVDGNFENLMSSDRVAGDGSAASKHILNGMSDCSSSGNLTGGSSRQSYHEPEFSTCKLFSENGNYRQEKLSQSDVSECGDDNFAGNPLLNKSQILKETNDRGIGSNGLANLSQKITILESLLLEFRKIDLVSIDVDSDDLNPLSDLKGDYYGHVRSLLYSQCCQGLALFAVVYHPPSPSSFEKKRTWDTVRRLMPLTQHSFPQENGSSGFGVAAVYPPSNVVPINGALGLEEKPKPRGTGTYFPRTNCGCRERPFNWRYRSRGRGYHGQGQRYFRGNGLEERRPGENNSSPEIMHPECTVEGWSNSGAASHTQSLGSENCANHSINSSCKLEFGSLGDLPEDVTICSPNSWSSTSRSISLEVQSSNPVLGREQERVVEQSLHLKNEEEFPPLSSDYPRKDLQHV